MYGALGEGSGTPEDDQEFERAIASMKASEADAIATAFAVLMDTLSPDYAKWPRWFRSVSHTAEQERATLSERVEIRDGGPHARNLTAFGLTPAVIVGAVRGIQLLADRLIFQSRLDREVWPDHSVLAALWRAVQRSRLRPVESRPAV